MSSKPKKREGNINLKTKIQMENFFIDEKFYGDLCDLMDDYDIQEEDLKDLEDDWSCKIEMANLEPCIKLTPEKLAEMLFDANEERFGEDFDLMDEERIMKCVKESVDFEKFANLMPKYYYPNGIRKVVTKQDLIDYCA